MSTGKKIGKNIFFQLMGHGIHLSLNIITMALIARYLGVEGYGRYSYIFILISMFIIVTDMGVNDIVVRDLSKDRTRTSRMIRDLIWLKLFLGISAVALSLMTVKVLGVTSEMLQLFAWASASLILMSMSSIGSIVFRVQLRMERFVAASMAKDVLLLLSVYIVTVYSGGVLEIIWATLLAHIINVAVTFFLLRDSMVASKDSFDLSVWKGILKSSIPLGLGYMIVTLYAGIDSLFLERMVGETSVGYYNASYKFVHQAIFIPVAFANSVFPVMSEYWSNNREKMKELFQKTYDYMVVMAVPMGVTVTILAPKLIFLIYGEEYAPSVPALQVLIWGVVVMFQSIVFGYTMVVLNEQKKSLFINAGGLITNVILNLLLIPHFTFVGAAIATVITEFFVIVPTIYIIQKKMGYTLSLVKLYKSLVVGVSCALLLIATNSLHLFVQLGICLAGVASLAYLLKLVVVQDLKVIFRS